jgi:hypothetical protein
MKGKMRLAEDWEKLRAGKRVWILISVFLPSFHENPPVSSGLPG